MSPTDVFLLAIRWLHLISAAAWVGGGLFYLFVLRPALRKAPATSQQVNAAAATEFRALVDTCIFVLLATGIILTFNRLTPGIAGTAYVVALGLKIALSVWMFVLARGRRRRSPILDAYQGVPAPHISRLARYVRAISGYTSLIILGIVIFLISDLLKVLFEISLRQ